MADDPAAAPQVPETAAPFALPGTAAATDIGGIAGEGPGVQSGTALPEPSAQPVPAAAPVEPAAEAAAEPEAKPAEPSKPAAETEAPKPAASLLSEALAAEGQKEPEAQPEGEAAQPPSYEFQFPDGYAASEERMAPFAAFLGEAGLNQEQGQRLIDMHIAEQQHLRDRLMEEQHALFNKTREGWRQEFEEDPELGGNRRQTTINSVVGFLRHFATDADHLRRVMDVWDFTGAGDHPDVIRLLANAARGMSQQYKEGAPVGAGQPAPQPESRYRRRYNASLNGSAVQ